MESRTVFIYGLFAALGFWPLVWIIFAGLIRFWKNWLWGTPLIQIPGIFLLWFALLILKGKHVKQYMFEGRLYVSPNSRVFALRDGTKEGPIS